MAKYKPKDLRVKTSDELKDQLKLLRKEQFNLRFQVTNGQNENPARFKQLRREIACIKTVIVFSALLLTTFPVNILLGILFSLNYSWYSII